MFYDEFARSFMFMGFTILSNFGWTERTAVLLADVISFTDTHKLSDICRNNFNMFTAFSQNFILLLAMAWAIFFADFWILELLYAIKYFLGY